MTIDTKAIAQTACRAMLRPIVKIMLRCGLPYREFAASAKSVYVSVASEEYGVRGRPANVSRVSIMTGIARREIKRLREQEDSAPVIDPTRINLASRILSGWHQDARYTDTDGKPIDLPAEGPAPSFESLFAQYGGDVPLTAMLRELKSVGAVEARPGNRLRAAKRYYMPASTDHVAVDRSASVMEDIGDTVNFNLAHQAGETTRFEGRATNNNLPRAAVPVFREYLESNALAFLEHADDWLTEQEVGEHHDDGVRLGVGVYMIQADSGKPATEPAPALKGDNENEQGDPGRSG